MKKEAGKSTVTPAWFDKLIAAYNRCNKSPMTLAKLVGRPTATIKTWLRKTPQNPLDHDELVRKLDAYLATPYISGPNPKGIARLWQTMRLLRKFADRELAVLANVSVTHCQKTLRLMRDNGYVRQSTQGWELIKDTGPNAPTISRNHKTLTDNNLTRK